MRFVVFAMGLVLAGCGSSNEDTPCPAELKAAGTPCTGGAVCSYSHPYCSYRDELRCKDGVWVMTTKTDCFPPFDTASPEVDAPTDTESDSDTGGSSDTTVDG